MLPAGSIVMWGSESPPPAGWLLCDGTIYEQAAYPTLYAAVGDSFGNPTNNPNFDPRTQFFVPDLRGRFVRGVDDTTEGSPRDPDRLTRTDMQGGQVVGAKVGSLQEDEFAEHNHSYYQITGSGGICNGDYWASQSSSTGNAGGSETRPVNAYVWFIICTG